MFNGRIINLGILCSGNTTQTQHCLLFKFQGTMKCKCDFNKHSQSNVIECFWTFFLFSLFLNYLLCVVTLLFFSFGICIFSIYFILQAILYYNTDLKILFLRFKYRITRINGEGQDIMKLIARPLIKLQFSLG